MTEVPITLIFDSTRGEVVRVVEALAKRWRVTTDSPGAPIDQGAEHADEPIAGHATIWYPGRREEGHRELNALLADIDTEHDVITGGDLFR